MILMQFTKNVVEFYWDTEKGFKQTKIHKTHWALQTHPTNRTYKNHQTHEPQKTYQARQTHLSILKISWEHP